MGSQRKVCCPYCPKKSFRPDNWKRHMNSFHPNMLTDRGQAPSTQDISMGDDLFAFSNETTSRPNLQDEAESGNRQYEQLPDSNSPKKQRGESGNSDINLRIARLETLMKSLEETTQDNVPTEVQKNVPQKFANDSSESAPEYSAECLEVDVEDYDDKPSYKVLEHLLDCPPCWPRLRRGLGPLYGIGQCLLAAVRHGKAALVQYLMKFGRILHYKDEQGLVALHHSIMSVISMDIVTLLCREGSSMNMLSNYGQSPLALACRRYLADTTVADFETRYAAIKTLIEAGADPDILDHNGDLPIHFLLEMPKQKLDQKDTYDAFVKCIELVASKTNNLNATGRHDQMPLEISIKQDVVASFEILLRHGADPSLLEGDAEELLGQVQSVDMLRFLMDALPDTMLCSPIKLRIALDYYIRGARDDLVDFLLDRSPEIIREGHYRDPWLLYRTFQGRFIDSASMFRIREALLKAGCDPNSELLAGDRNFHHWAREQIDVVRKLSDVRIRDETEPYKFADVTTLLSASEMRLRTAELLTRYDADINAVNDERETPLGILIGIFLKAHQTCNGLPVDEPLFNDILSKISAYGLLINGMGKLGARLLASEKVKSRAAWRSNLNVYNALGHLAFCTVESCKVIETI